MFAPPLHVTYKVYGKSAESHPDLDDRSLQVAMEDRLAQHRLQRQRRRRRLRGTLEKSRGRSEEVGVEARACSGTGLNLEDQAYIFSPAREGWLIKRGSGGLRMWRRRWVGLANKKLWY